MATRFWVLSNEDARAPIFRQRYAEQHQGTWTFSNDSGWNWSNEPVKVENKVQKVEKEETEVPAKRKFFKKKD